MYSITAYTLHKAQMLGVKVLPSTNPKKKIDVFRDGKKIASVGARGMMDFPSYLERDGRIVALKKREAYWKRHHKDVLSGNGYWAAHLLW